ncbi:MAG: hypothetical protein STSR0002_07590 [Smithella sp.]
MKNKSIFTLSIVYLVMLFLISGCQTIPQAQKAEEPNPAQVIIKYSEPDGIVGTARYYKKRYNGRKTTSGEIYSSKKLTAGKYKRLDYFFTLKDFSLWSK